MSRGVIYGLDSWAFKVLLKTFPFKPAASLAALGLYQWEDLYLFNGPQQGLTLREGLLQTCGVMGALSYPLLLVSSGEELRLASVFQSPRKPFYPDILFRHDFPEGPLSVDLSGVDLLLQRWRPHEAQMIQIPAQGDPSLYRHLHSLKSAYLGSL